MTTSSPSGRAPAQVTVTGAAGNIGYALLFRLASGELLGPDQPIVLRLLEIEPAMRALEGVVMELDDCAFPLLADVVTTSDLKIAFDGASLVFLVGSVPRKAGMERKDLLGVNGGIFRPQGKAIAENAGSDVRVLVVGNPCNTNCLIARSNAPEVPAERWFAMTAARREPREEPTREEGHPAGGDGHEPRSVGQSLLDAVPRLRERAHRRHARAEVIGDDDWLHGAFLQTIQKRGAAIIDARGSSSAASAANAAIDSMRSVLTPTKNGDWSSLAVASRGEYGVPDGLQFGFPVRSDGKTWSIVEGLEHSEFAQTRIAATTDELIEERAEVTDLLG